MVSIQRNRAIREKEVGKTIGGHKKKGEFEWEVHKKQKTSEPYTHLS
jgi:hypothetical protein